MKRYGFLLLVATIAACSPEKAKETASNAAEKVADATSNAAERVQDQFDVATPTGPRATPEQIEKERFNEEWQRLQSFREASAKREALQPPPSPPTAPPVNVQIVAVQGKSYGESLKGIQPETIDKAPVRLPIRGDVQGPSVLRSQVLLDRNSFSVGSIDGRWGKNSAIAVYWFQRAKGLETTGVVDEPTYRLLMQGAGALPLVRQYQITPDDVKGPFNKIPDDVYDQEKLDCLCYETAMEALAEKFHSTEGLLLKLNPTLANGTPAAGQSIWVPYVRNERAEGAGLDVKQIVVSVQGNYLHGLGADQSILFHAPTTVGSKYDPSPEETLKVVKIAHDPHFHYQPKLFHEVPDTDPEANLKPGPNSPVGVVWMALSKKHFGIHGTGDPDSIGYAASHGCVRLANWDAREVSYRAAEGTMVSFVDVRESKAADTVKQNAAAKPPQSGGSRP